MNHFSDDLFKFGDDEEDASSTNKQTITQTLTQIIEERRREFIPLSKSQAPLKASRQLQHKPNISEAEAGRGQNIAKNPTRLLKDEVVQDSPSKYQAIECDDSEDSDRDNRNYPNSSTRDYSAQASQRIPKPDRIDDRVTPLQSQPGSSSIIGSSRNTNKIHGTVRTRRFPTAVQKNLFQFDSEDEPRIEVIKSPTTKLGSTRPTGIPARIRASIATNSISRITSPREGQQGVSRIEFSPRFKDADIDTIETHTPASSEISAPPSSKFDLSQIEIHNNNTTTESPLKRNGASTSEFTTPDRNRTVIPDSDEEELLEQTIIDIESPAKPSPLKSLVSKRSLLLLSQSQASSGLSANISDDPSTPASSGVTALLERTPIAQWIQKGKEDIHTMDLDISEFESPKKSERRSMACSEFNSELWTVVGGRRRKKRGLADQMRGILSRYESSVRMFSHDLRNGKFEEDLAMPLIIRTIFGRDSRLLWTICYDIKGKSNRCILFKPHHPQEITCNVMLKLYKPWKEIDVPGVPIPVIICTDFYKIIHKPGDLDVNISDDFVKRIIRSSTVEMGNLHSFRMIPADGLKHIFLSLVPYGVLNQNTITKQINRFRCFINLDIVIQNVWSSTNGYIVLIRDSDGVFSLLQVPDTNEHLQQVLSPGTYIKFNKLGVNSKITFVKDATLFSVLSIYGSKQVSYYNLGLRRDTEWDTELDLEIDFGKAECQRKFIHEIQQIGFFDDERVSIECTIKTRTQSAVTVMDKVGSLMKIDLVARYGSSPHIFRSLIPKKHVLIRFLRVFQEKPTYDDYSIVEERKEVY